jgi:transcriptional regulator with XRE-family HTH domain
MTNINNFLLLDDKAILNEIGARISQHRINRQLSQARLAEQAGVSKRTVERIESGGSAQMSSMIRVFRVLDLLPGLDAMIPETGPRPMDILKLEGKKRQRAYSSRGKVIDKETKWSWDDEP